MNFTRKQNIALNISPKRALIVYGPRRIGKTTMSLDYLKSLDSNIKTKYVVGDDINIRFLFATQDRKELLDFVADIDVLVIDEAQIIPSIGIGIKMILDALPSKTIILTGSSSFVLSEEIGEPLVGRQFQMTLLPISIPEMKISNFEKKQHLEDLLVYGSYPEVLLEDSKVKKEFILNELLSSSLFKDIFILDKIKSPDLLVHILKCLAVQIGQEVSIKEITETVHADKRTVTRYLELLEKIFIIKKVDAYSNNKRSEIKTKSKYFFYDLGIRNAVISNFINLENRNDIGLLFENFIFMEIYKKELFLNPYFRDIYFWRNKEGYEVDIVVEKKGQINAYECKWKESKSPFKIFKNLYPEANTFTVHRDNFIEVIESD